MTERAGNIKTVYELAEMLKRLPEREQLRVEDVIVDLVLAREQTSSGERREGA